MWRKYNSLSSLLIYCSVFSFINILILLFFFGGGGIIRLPLLLNIIIIVITFQLKKNQCYDKYPPGRLSISFLYIYGGQLEKCSQERHQGMYWWIKPIQIFVYFFYASFTKVKSNHFQASLGTCWLGINTCATVLICLTKYTMHNQIIHISSIKCMLYFTYLRLCFGQGQL